MSETSKTTIITALITTAGLIAVAAIGKLDFSKGSPIPGVGGCKQVTASQIAKVDQSIDGIEETIGTQTGLSPDNHRSIAKAIKSAKIAVAEVRGAC